MTKKDEQMADHEVYQHTVQRLEPDVHPVDTEGALASIAISLKRIADSLDVIIAMAKDAGP